MSPPHADRQTFKNEDLVLKVSANIDPAVWDEAKYEAFVDELCGNREYQKDATRTVMRFLAGQKYRNLRELAKETFDNNPEMERRYGSWAGMERHLQLPDQLSCSIDMATGTGKSYVLYGLAAILLAEGIVDRVLVLCPSNTIEDGLLTKFRDLAGNADLRAVLPAGARVFAPKIINASETIVVPHDQGFLLHSAPSLELTFATNSLGFSIEIVTKMPFDAVTTFLCSGHSPRSLRDNPWPAMSK